MRQSRPTNEDIIPEFIRLYDGRLFSVEELLKSKRKNYKSYKIKNSAAYFNVEDRTPKKEHVHRNNISMTLFEVMSTYNISRQQAISKIMYSYQALGLPKPSRADIPK